MTNNELRRELWTIKGYCDINQRYNQQPASRCGTWDKGAKIAVAITAAIAFAAVFLNEHWKALEGIIAFIALAMAIVLNVLPFGEYQKTHDHLFLGWSHLPR